MQVLGDQDLTDWLGSGSHNNSCLAVTVGHHGHRNLKLPSSWYLLMFNSFRVNQELSQSSIFIWILWILCGLQKYLAPTATDATEVTVSSTRRTLTSTSSLTTTLSITSSDSTVTSTSLEARLLGMAAVDYVGKRWALWRLFFLFFFQTVDDFGDFGSAFSRGASDPAA